MKQTHRIASRSAPVYRLDATTCWR